MSEFLNDVHADMCMEYHKACSMYVKPAVTPAERATITFIHYIFDGIRTLEEAMRPGDVYEEEPCPRRFRDHVSRTLEDMWIDIRVSHDEASYKEHPVYRHIVRAEDAASRIIDARMCVRDWLHYRGYI